MSFKNKEIVFCGNQCVIFLEYNDVVNSYSAVQNIIKIDNNYWKYGKIFSTKTSNLKSINFKSGDEVEIFESKGEIYRGVISHSITSRLYAVKLESGRFLSVYKQFLSPIKFSTSIFGLHAVKRLFS